MLIPNLTWSRMCERFLARRAKTNESRSEYNSLGFEALEQRLLLSASPTQPDPLEVDSPNQEVIANFTPLPPGYVPLPYDGVFAAERRSLDQLPIWNSNPGATHALYLDFDGYFMNGNWDSQGQFYDFETPAFDLDGDPLTFNQSEIDFMYEVFQRVAEDYSIFDINVTTNRNYNGNGVQATVVIGGDGFWYDPSEGAAGVALIGTAGSKPAWAFSELIGANAAFIAGTVSHEAGHSFGLLHQALWQGDNLEEEYNPGGTTEFTDVDWSPLMGGGTNMDIWYKGSTPLDPEHIQDDIQFLASVLGYRADDFAGDGLLHPITYEPTTPFTPAVLQQAYNLGMLGQTALQVNGVIGHSDIVFVQDMIDYEVFYQDLDMFRFDTTGGKVSVRVEGAEHGQNLDAVYVITNNFGAPITTVNPLGNNLDAIGQFDLPAGTYYVLVTKTFQYGFSGQYTLTVEEAGGLGSVPKLNSKPDAWAQIYLDFNGHSDNQHGAFGNINTPAFDLDGDPSTFTQNELDAMYEIWYRVAEDLAPFNVNVTTNPIQMISGRTMRIVIGGSGGWDDVDGNVTNAITGSWYDPTDFEGYVFSNQLNGNITAIANAVSRTIGENFGLQQRGTFTQTTNGVNWSTIMASDVEAGDVRVWHLSSAGEGGIQNDFAVIRNAVGLVDDDHGSSFNDPASWGLVLGPVFQTGVISRNDDVDVFKFSTLGGEVSFDLAVAQYGPNLDAVMVLYDEFGNVVAADGPDILQTASLNVELDPGIYHLVVRSTQEYGFVGQYRVTASFIPHSRGQVYGNVWHDANNDLVRDVNERDMPGWLVFTDINGNLKFDRGYEQAARVDSNGNYVLLYAPTGNYNVRLQTPAGWLVNKAGGPDHSVNVFQGLPTPADFSVRQNIVRHQYLDHGGRRVTLTLNGHGQMEVLRAAPAGPANATAINLVNTTKQSVLTINVAGKNTRTLIDGDVNITGAMGAIHGINQASINGNINSTNVVNRVSFDNVFARNGQNNWNIGPGATSADSFTLVAKKVFDTTINSASGFGAVNVQSWQDQDNTADSLNGPTMNHLVLGNRNRKAVSFADVDVNLTGMDELGRSLVRATLFTTLYRDWDMAGGIGVVNSQAVGKDFIGNIGGTITNWVMQGNFFGTLTANRIGQMTVRGGIIDSTFTLNRTADEGGNALGQLLVTGGIGRSLINSAGNINFVRAAAMRATTFNVGVSNANANAGQLVGNLGAYNQNATFNRLVITTKRATKAGASFSENFINARNIGYFDLGSVPTQLNMAETGIAMENFGQIIYRQGNRITNLRYAADLLRVPSAGQFILNIN